ncbi:MAG: DUF6186 family protein [Actinomycetota bacterium]|nr:DUF6186 family protein [Actinomycetota bacterium]
MTPYAVLATGFALVCALMLAMQLLAMAGWEPFRSLGEALHAAVVSATGRWVVLGVWLWIGFHFLAR